MSWFVRLVFAMDAYAKILGENRCLGGFKLMSRWPLLGGSRVVINGAISPLLKVIRSLLITPLITTHEAPSTLT